MIGMDKNKQFLDDKRCFDLWIETNSLYKAQAVLAREGLINPKTGRPPTVMGIWTAAWRWGIANPQDARKLVGDVYHANGEILSNEEWDVIIQEKRAYLFAKKVKK
jgi:hypothetical protein